MLEALSVPILMKAVNFLFEEGSKILQERRERRKAELEAKLNQTTTEPKETTKAEDENLEESEPSEVPVEKPTDEVEEPPSVIESKEAALNTPIDEIAWEKSKAEVENLVSLLEIYTKNYHLAREQYAKFGSALVPPIIVHNLEEAEKQIVIVTEELQQALGKVYGKPVLIQGDEGK